MTIGPVREPRFAPVPQEPSTIESPRAPIGGPVPSEFATMLARLGTELRSGESLMRGAIGVARVGRNLDPGEIIALQAGVYRYVEAVDLTARLVDRATSAVKTVVQGQST
jgi:hypothetical protein